MLKLRLLVCNGAEIYTDMPSIYYTVDKEDKSQRFPYPSQVIYGTAQNYGFVVKKKEQWAMEQMENDQFTPQWGNERQVRGQLPI